MDRRGAPQRAARVRHVAPAVHRSGDGEGTGRYRVLPAVPFGLAERSGRRSAAVRDLGGRLPSTIWSGRNSWPHALLATSTHDSKRSEDVRARINVLSEIPADWQRAIRSWRELNAGLKTKLTGGEAPSAAEEYLFYQTLAGVWPLKDPAPGELEELTGRVTRLHAKSPARSQASFKLDQPKSAVRRGRGPVHLRLARAFAPKIRSCAR